MLFAPVISAFVAPAYAEEPASPILEVNVGESMIRKEPRALARVLLSNPEIAELKLLEEGQFQVRGVAVGNTDLWIWYRDDIDHPRVYKVVVQSDLTDVQRRVSAAVPDGQAPRVYPLRDHIVVDGVVEDLETLERVAAIAKVFDPEFVNLMSVRGDHQVQLHVVFAEVSRTGLRELGINALVAGPTWVATSSGPVTAAGGSIAGGGQSIGPQSSGVFTLLSSVALGGIEVGAILSVLEQYSLARTLAEPTVVALSGQQAEFLAGGEVPIPVAQNNGRISIEFKEYGVKLVFVPTVLGGETIDMRAYVEVSDIDRSNATRVSGIEIPAFTSRKGDTHLRVEDGMTFAMAGMLKDREASTRAAVPLLGDLPVVGALFRYVKHQREETELVIFVTPELVRPMAPGEVPSVPGSEENFNPGDFELFLLGSLTQPGSRTAEPTGDIGLHR